MMANALDLLVHSIKGLPRESFAAMLGILGLFVGSFLNVVVWRLPRMLEVQWAREAAHWAGHMPPVTPIFNLAWPPSRCPRCDSRIPAWHNLPVVSYLLLRGRCAHCQVAISLRYPIVELSAGVMFAAIGWTFAPLMLYATMFAWCGFGAALLSLSLIDAETRLLPDVITLPLLWIGLLLSVAGVTVPVGDAVLGAALGYVAMWLIAGGHFLLTGNEGLGGGDVKLVAACGAWLGWIGVPLTLAFGAVAATLAFGVLGILRGRTMCGPLPFGPWLAAGAVASALWGERFLGLWLYAGS